MKLDRLHTRDAFVLVTLIWVGLSVLGALPFLLSGTLPNFADALFESAAGWTTTGVSVIDDLDSAPKWLLFWRSFTQFLGGMGVLIIFMAILPGVDGGRAVLLRTENSSAKVVPRLGETAKRLYAIYLVLTVAVISALVIAGLPIFDAVTLGFATAGTGGFVVTNGGIAGYGSAAVEMILAVFMLAFSLNFAVYYSIAARRRSKSTEAHVFLGVVFVSIVAVWISLTGRYGVWEALRHAVFGVASFSSTTLFEWDGWGTWPAFSRTLLMLLPIIGACSGSTGGGLKMGRAVILVKSMARELRKIVRPREVAVVRSDGRAVEESAIAAVFMYFASFIIITLVAALALSWDLGVAEGFSSALSCMTNAGLEGLNFHGLYSRFSPLSKVILTLCMLIGRLEIFPVLVLLYPATWRRK
ncbi:potassium transporter KefA [Clostridia bacterium]|nr:potassium transporter KefA [Clostridia bacterium]GHV31556.1 potassium transporter KefA [Clostridia bacterium]